MHQHYPEKATMGGSSRQVSYRLLWTVLAVVAGICSAAACTGWKIVNIHTINITDNAVRTERILRTTPLIDGHNDLPYLLRLELQNKIYNNKTFNFSEGDSNDFPDTTAYLDTNVEQALPATQTSKE